MEGTIIFCRRPKEFSGLSSSVGIQIDEVRSEKELIEHLVNLVHSIDPDVVVSYEMQSSSLGYVQERSLHVYSITSPFYAMMMLIQRF